MATAKVFKSGNSQAIRLPREFRFDVSEVEIFRTADGIVLRPRISEKESAASVYDALVALGEAFPDLERPPQGLPQEREAFDDWSNEPQGTLSPNKRKKAMPSGRRKSA